MHRTNQLRHCQYYRVAHTSIISSSVSNLCCVWTILEIARILGHACHWQTKTSRLVVRVSFSGGKKPIANATVGPPLLQSSSSGKSHALQDDLVAGAPAGSDCGGLGTYGSSASRSIFHFASNEKMSLERSCAGWVGYDSSVILCFTRSWCQEEASKEDRCGFR